MAAGEITPEEALSVARFLEGRMRVLKAWQLEQKLTRWDNPLPVPGDHGPSPIPNPPPKEGWPDITERMRRRAVTPSPPTPSSNPTRISSPPAERGEKDAQSWRGNAEPYPKLDEGGAAACEMSDKPDVNPSAGAKTPHLAQAKRDASLSLRNPPEPKSNGLQAGEGETEPAGAGASPPLFSPHLRSLIEAGMADRADNRWLAVLDEEWGLNGRLALHLPCKSQVPALSSIAPAPSVAAATQGVPQGHDFDSLPR